MEDCIRKIEDSVYIIDKSYSASENDDITASFDILQKIVAFRSAAAFLLNKRNEHYEIMEIINHSFEQRWLQEYPQYKHINSDPVFDSALRTSKPVMWDDSWNSSTLSNYITKIGATRHFGHPQGILFPFPVKDMPDKQIVIALAIDLEDHGDSSGGSDKKQLLLYVSILLRYICNGIVSVYKRKIKNGIACSINSTAATSQAHLLTNRETQVLEWVTKGKTSWEIAMILSISERTVKFHLSNIYQKLGVVNRQQAVAQALSTQILQEH